MAKRVDEDGPSDLAALLPFYLNGTLSAEDLERFEAALADDPELRADLEREQAAAAFVREHGAELAPQADQGIAEGIAGLMRKIDAETGPAPAEAPRVIPFRPRAKAAPLERGWFWRPAFAAAAVIVVIQAGVLLHGAAPANQYRGLSGPPPAPSTKGARLLVRPSPDARWRDVEALLSKEGLTVVGGPRDGTLDVILPAGAKADAVAGRLRASRLVAFAAPES